MPPDTPILYTMHVLLFHAVIIPLCPCYILSRILASCMQENSFPSSYVLVYLRADPSSQDKTEFLAANIIRLYFLGRWFFSLFLCFPITESLVVVFHPQSEATLYLYSWYWVSTDLWQFYIYFVFYEYRSIVSWKCLLGIHCVVFMEYGKFHLITNVNEIITGSTHSSVQYANEHGVGPAIIIIGANRPNLVGTVLIFRP